MSNNIAVIVEHDAGRICPATFDALASAVELQSIYSSDMKCVVIGDHAVELASQALEISGVSCLGVTVDGLRGYNSEAYLDALTYATNLIGACWICVAGTTQGHDFAPGLAVRIGAPCISDVERIYKKGSAPVFVRSMFNGKVSAELQVDRPAVIITQPGSFKWGQDYGHHSGHVDSINFEWKPTHTRVIGVTSPEQSDSALTEASVVISAGRGIRRKENLELIRKVSGLFTRSSIACSRPLCDDGWLPYRLQVGQTGTTVSPDLYIACGISGAQQHLAGMRGAKFIIAVNADPDAPIFHEADIGVVEDAESFLDELVQLVIASTDIPQE